MDKFLDQFSKVPLVQKLAGLLVVVGLIAAGTYFMIVSPAQDTMKQNDEKLAKQDVDLQKLQVQAQNRTQFLREVERLKQRLREAEEQLPKQAEIPKLLKDIEFEAKQSGLRMDRFQLEGDQAQGDFFAVPVKMSVRGSYHEIAVFLDRLSKLPRIVNANDLMMQTPTKEANKIMVSSSFTATTYRFNEAAVKR